MNNTFFCNGPIVASQSGKPQVGSDSYFANPPLILQSSLSEFKAAISKEFLEGSAIDPDLFAAAIKFAAEIDTGYGGEPILPIHEALGWQHSGKKRFGQPTLYAAFFENEDGSVWQAKLSQQTWDVKKGKFCKPYKAPKGNGARAYLPPLPVKIRQAIGQRNKVDVPLDGSFWDWLEAHPGIPILLIEGGKKLLAVVSLGYVSIGLYGCDAGVIKNQDGTLKLIPDLERFHQPGREFIIALDRDDKRETVKRVAYATSRLASLLQGDEGQNLVKIALWENSQGKGVDDLIVNQGADLWHKVYSNASPLPKQAIWNCLPSHNHQIGKWERIEALKNTQQADQLLVRAKSDPNLKLIEELQDGQSDKLKFESFTPKTDFDFKVSKILSAADGGGVTFKITQVRGLLLVTREVYIKSTETTQVKDFTNALKRELGYDVACTLKLEQLQALLQNRRAKYQQRGGETYRLADRVGQQDDGIWVFENNQFKPDGTPITEAESLWVFNHQLGETEKIPSPEIAPQNPNALPNLAQACIGFFHPEILPLVWFTCGYAVATLQRQEVMRKERNFPQLSLFGDAGGAKTTAAKVAAALVGMHLDRYVIVRFSESLIYELVKSLGGLLVLIDDPVKRGMWRDSKDAIDNFLWAMFNGATRKVRGNEQTPHSNVLVTSNVALGEGNQAIESRLIKIPFPVRPQIEAGFPALEEAMHSASGGLSQLLGIHYDRSAVRKIRSRLLEHLSGAHSRISLSYALLTYFTQGFCDVAGIEFDAFEYCVTHLCPIANDFESDKDSLTDFFEKLAQMRAEGAVGDWNCTKVKSQHKSYLAIVLSDLWGEFEQRFKPNYSRQSIEQLIEGRGGKKTTQKFVATKLECVDFARAMAAYKRGESLSEPTRPAKKASRKAILIPESELQAGYLNDDSVIDSSFSDYATDIFEDGATVASSNLEQLSPEKVHSRKLLITQWVRDAGLTKDESRVLRQELFGERWKLWKSYTDADMKLLEGKISEFALAKRSMPTTMTNFDDNWSDSDESI